MVSKWVITPIYSIYKYVKKPFTNFLGHPSTLCLSHDWLNTGEALHVSMALALDEALADGLAAKPCGRCLVGHRRSIETTSHQLLWTLHGW